MASDGSTATNARRSRDRRVVIGFDFLTVTAHTDLRERVI
jgi:hypothetical protein